MPLHKIVTPALKLAALRVKLIASKTEYTPVMKTKEAAWLAIIFMDAR